jgi:hemerythrin-like metal-binding protein
MRFIVWDDSLKLKIDLIDEEHKILIFLMNKLHKQYNDGEPQETVRATFSELTEYATKHFKDEEDYMESINFSDLDAHRAIHKKLLDRLSTYFQEFDDSNGQISEYFFTFLKLWVTAHIKGIDAKYVNVS